MANSYARILSQYDLACNSLFGPIDETCSPAKVKSMKGSVFERCLVAVITEVAEKRGFKHKPLAEAAWPDKKDPGTKWRKIRNGTEPRGLQVDDAYDLAVAMGMSFVELCGMAQGRMLEHAPSEKLAPQVTGKKEEAEAKAIYGQGPIQSTGHGTSDRH